MATLDEIAKAAGVSEKTVSNILNGRNKENWPSTAKRAAKVRAIAERLNYRPNSAAKAIASGRFGAIGLLNSTDASSSHMFEQTFRAIEARLEERDLHLSVGSLPDEKLVSENYVPKLLREWAADALIVNYIADIPQRMIDLIYQYRIPSVWLNVKREHDCIYPDDFAGAKQATEYLIKLGHRSIAYLHPTNSSHYSVADRESGYVEAMRAAKLKKRVISYEHPHPLKNSSVTLPIDVSRNWLSGPLRPTAVLSYSSLLAYSVYCAAVEQGLKVPHDISIVAFDDRPAIAIGLPVTTICIPAESMGYNAVSTVLQKLDNPDVMLQPQALPLTLIEGITCAPPPAPKP